LAEDIKRLAGQFQTLLKSVLTKPEALIGEVEILERSANVSNCSSSSITLSSITRKTSVSTTCLKTGKEYTRQHMLHLKIAALTYAELARANQLAHYLQRLEWVQRCWWGVERSLEMVGILGILKAGGVCATRSHIHKSG